MFSFQDMRYGKSFRNVPINSVILIVLLIFALFSGPIQAASYGMSLAGLV